LDPFSIPSDFHFAAKFYPSKSETCRNRHSIVERSMSFLC
jgi:hypothetical protein